MKRLTVLALALIFAACSSPVDPGCVEVVIPFPGYELPVDSLEAEGWKVLEGDTIAVREDPGGCTD